MKKIKLLMPMLGLTSIATIAMPLTSCGGDGSLTPIDKNYHPSKAYTPTAEEKTKGVSAETALDIYLKALETDPKIHIEEIKYHIALNIQESLKEGVTSLTVQCSLPTMTYTKDKKTVSFDITTISEMVKDGKTYNMENKAKVTDMPICIERGVDCWLIYHENDQSKWKDTTKIIGYVKGNGPSSSGDITYTGKERTIDKNTIIPSGSKTQDDVEIDMVYSIICYLGSAVNGVCYYLKDLPAEQK